MTLDMEYMALPWKLMVSIIWLIRLEILDVAFLLIDEIENEVSCESRSFIIDEILCDKEKEYLFDKIVIELCSLGYISAYNDNFRLSDVGNIIVDFLLNNKMVRKTVFNLVATYFKEELGYSEWC